MCSLLEKMLRVLDFFPPSKLGSVLQRAFYGSSGRVRVCFPALSLVLMDNISVLLFLSLLIQINWCF